MTAVRRRPAANADKTQTTTLREAEERLEGAKRALFVPTSTAQCSQPRTLIANAGRTQASRSKKLEAAVQRLCEAHGRWHAVAGEVSGLLRLAGRDSRDCRASARSLRSWSVTHVGPGVCRCLRRCRAVTQGPGTRAGSRGGVTSRSPRSAVGLAFRPGPLFGHRIGQEAESVQQLLAVVGEGVEVLDRAAPGTCARLADQPGRVQRAEVMRDSSQLAALDPCRGLDRAHVCLAQKHSDPKAGRVPEPGERFGEGIQINHRHEKYSASCACSAAPDRGCWAFMPSRPGRSARPVPLSVPRLDGYVRVSRVGKRYGDRFISPAVQREEIETWAASREVVLLRVFEELDESGTRANRPLLLEAIRRTESGVSDGLVVSKVSRFGRSLIDGLVAIDRIRGAGGTFYSVADGFDTGTDAGRLVLRIMLSMAEWEIDRTRADWAVAKEQAIKRGVSIASCVPPGYRKTRTGRLLPDPRTGPVMAEVFRRRADGVPVPHLCRFLETEGVLTAHDNPGWNTTSLYRVLSNRVYIGELRGQGLVRVDVHPPLIDAATWEAAQRPRQLFRTLEPIPVLLRGMLRCASCSMLMGVLNKQPAPRAFYQCRRRFAGGRCCGPAGVTAAHIDAYVTKAFFTLLGRRRQPPHARLSALEDRAAQASRALASYRDNDTVRRMLGDDAFVAGVATRLARVRDAQLMLAGARDCLDTHELPSAAETRAQWPTLELLEQRVLIAQVIDCVFVARGQGCLPERVTVCPIGTAPTYTRPIGGAKAAKLHTIRAKRGWMNPRPAGDRH